MVLSEDERERLLAESREKFLYDQYHREKEGYEKGLAKGEANERAKAYQEKLEAARKLKLAGVPADTIAEGLGIAREEIDL
jgi:predicted transposase YdaD